ncbi:hypothetical protein IWW55_005557 [Coemansia sp. RSA 2706]|nr:hypothetical protein IWW55_005557 [Coemansia sp. RSA 2706]
MQATLALLKPDLLADPRHLPQILSLLHTRQFLIKSTTHTRLTLQDAQRFYREHTHKPFFSRLVTYMTSGPLVALALVRPHAISEWRLIIGASQPVRMRVENTQCLRARFGVTDTRNSFHGSDSVESAQSELEFFFGQRAYDKFLA